MPFSETLIVLLASLLAMLVALQVFYSTRLRRRMEYEEFELRRRMLELEFRRIELSEGFLKRQESIQSQHGVLERSKEETLRIQSLERALEALPRLEQQAALVERHFDQQREIFQRFQLQLADQTHARLEETSNRFLQALSDMDRRLRLLEQWIIQLKPPMIETTSLFAGVSALMAALQALQRERDYRLAKETFNRNFQQNLTSPETQRAAQFLESVAPPNVIQKLYENARRCWEHWLDSEKEPQMPGQEREADAAVKACICRQLKRILDLNGSLPSEWQQYWDLYQCDVKKRV